MSEVITLWMAMDKVQGFFFFLDLVFWTGDRSKPTSQQQVNKCITKCHIGEVMGKPN